MRCLQCLVLLLLAAQADANLTPFPQRVTAAEANSLPCARETVHARPDALLLTPVANAEPAARDERNGGSYESVCFAYLADAGVFEKRFAVHVPSRAHLPFAVRAARFMALLWTLAERRFGRSCSRLHETVLDVWLARDGEPGGEQVNNSLYVYNVLAERTGIEWARELAHEYGHYLLPGASGYTDPESWANGMLGERLFLEWLAEDIDSLRLDSTEVPFVTPEDLRDYRAKQVAPLIDQFRRAGADPALLRRTDRSGMNAFTGLLLYIDSTYGSPVILDMLDYLPRDLAGRVRGIGFLDAFMTWVARAQSFQITIRAGGIMVYLPAGEYAIKPQKQGLRLSNLPSDVSFARAGASYTGRVRKSGWRRLDAEDAPISLRWTRRATGP